MMDYGQYSEKEVMEKLKGMSGKGSGVCERCGAKTKTKKVFGMTICNTCWNKQTKR